MAVEYRLDSGLSNAEAHTSLFLCKSQSWVCMTCPSSSRWAAGCLQLCSSPLGFLLSSLARAFEACSRGRSRSQGAGAWTPPILCQPQGNLFSAWTALDYSDGNWKQVFFLYTMPVAMALLRDVHNLCPKEVLTFILDLIKYNDNRKNKVRYFHVNKTSQWYFVFREIFRLWNHCCVHGTWNF